MKSSVEIRIAQRGPFADGHAFGEAGACERLPGDGRTVLDLPVVRDGGKVSRGISQWSVDVDAA